MTKQLSKEEVEEIRKLAKERINVCKDKCYSNGREASNDLEGDYGTWRQWENVLVDFAIKIKTNDRCKTNMCS